MHCCKLFVITTDLLKNCVVNMLWLQVIYKTIYCNHVVITSDLQNDMLQMKIKCGEHIDVNIGKIVIDIIISNMWCCEFSLSPSRCHVGLWCEAVLQLVLDLCHWLLNSIKAGLLFDAILRCVKLTKLRNAPCTIQCLPLLCSITCCRYVVITDGLENGVLKICCNYKWFTKF